MADDERILYTDGCEETKRRNKTFFNNIVKGRRDIIQLLLSMLEETGSEYCVIGGLAVNAYAEPVVSLDLDLVIVSSCIDLFSNTAVSRGMTLQKFEHSINLTEKTSDLRVQIQTDPRYQEFIPRGEKREVLGYELKVACLEDVLQGKVWAYSDETRRKSKRQKDLSDILRLVETHPCLKDRLPPPLFDLVD